MSVPALLEPIVMSDSGRDVAGDNNSIWDVIVIGAGPAGSVSARELARRGRRVLLLDRAHFPRPKVCGCCLNGAAVNTLERLGLGHVLTGGVPLNRTTVAAGHRTADLRLPRGVALSREVLDARLIAEAVKVGVEFRPGIVAHLGESGPDFRTVFLGSGHRLSARVAIVASGLTGGESPAAPGSRIGAGVVVPAENARSFFSPGTIYLATARGGYVGLVCIEGDRLDVAAAFDPSFVKASGGLGPAAEAILGEVGWPVPTALAELPWKGTPALTRRPIRRAGYRMFAVGDAAGYVEPFTGEGMAWAVTSAVAIGPIAERAVINWEPGLVRNWEATQHRILASRQRVCRVVARVLRSVTLTRIVVGTLSMLPAIARPLVAAINRKEKFN